MAWDQKYRCLKEGEAIRATDESLESDHPWHGGNEHWKQIPPHMVGRRASDPDCVAHSVYRRRRPFLSGLWCMITHPVRVFVDGRISAYRLWRRLG